MREHEKHFNPTQGIATTQANIHQVWYAQHNRDDFLLIYFILLHLQSNWFIFPYSSWQANNYLQIEGLILKTAIFESLDALTRVLVDVFFLAGSLVKFLHPRLGLLAVIEQ
jgi:hypothetical protein